MEQWKPIPFATDYEISNSGSVRSFKYHQPRIMKERTVRGGYRSVCIRVDGVSKYYRNSRLVLLIFVGSCPDGYEASHLNGINTDDGVENLAWEPHVENIRHKKTHGTQPYGETSPTAKLTQAQVDEIRRLSAAGVKSARLAADFGVSYTNIWSLISNRHWRIAEAS